MQVCLNPPYELLGEGIARGLLLMLSGDEHVGFRENNKAVSGIYWDNERENTNYHSMLGFRVVCLFMCLLASLALSAPEDL